MKFVAWTRSLPALVVVSLETREGAAIERSVRRAAEALGPGRTLRVILGMETSDDERREQVLGKRMWRAAIRRSVEAVASVAAAGGGSRVGLTFNLLRAAPAS